MKTTSYCLGVSKIILLMDVKPRLVGRSKKGVNISDFQLPTADLAVVIGKIGNRKLAIGNNLWLNTKKDLF